MQGSDGLLGGFELAGPASLALDVGVADSSDVFPGVAGLPGHIGLTYAAFQNSLTDGVEEFSATAAEQVLRAPVGAQGVRQCAVAHVLSVADPNVAYERWQRKYVHHVT